MYYVNYYFMIIASVCLLFCGIVSDTISKTRTTNERRLNECASCMLLVKSFKYWLRKTTRGKFEGGDAYWEENKLKSYSHSELRLVEIQEGLCSELLKYKDDCYSVAEHSETLIEQWWNEYYPDEVDLSLWLCAESLAVCCPQGHYGQDCLKCKDCAKNTHCHGEGTRRGSGKCICSKGYELIDGLCRVANVCHHNACKSGTFCLNIEGNKQCLPCHPMCKTCSGPNRTDCTQCPQNFVHSFTGSCINTHSPDSKQFSTTMVFVLPIVYAALKFVSIFFKSRNVYFIAFQIIFIAVHYYFGFIYLLIEFVYDILECWRCQVYGICETST